MKPFPSCIKDNIDGGGGDNDGDGSDDDGGVIKYGAQFGGSVRCMGASKILKPARRAVQSELN